MDESQQIKDMTVSTSEISGSSAIPLIGSEGRTLNYARDRQAQILGQYTPEQQQEILYRQRVLSSLAYFIGKDFRIPVELNNPGEGWHYAPIEDVVRIDPQDLIEKPMDYLRFVISHEGGHRRISRVEDIPVDVWSQPGFSFMANTIEDPRTNNFVAEAYPKFAEQMGLAYDLDIDFEKKAKEDAKDELGFRPKFMQAGFEYIKQWFLETQGREQVYSEDLPEDVKAVVEKTLESARDAWLRYPSRAEADRSEDIIRKYAKVTYEIERDEIWPEFKKLVDEDMKDERMQELLKNMQGEGGEGTQSLGESLTEGEQQELKDAIQNAMQQTGNQGKEGQEGKPIAIDLDSLSPGLKQKITDYIDSLPEDVKRELEKRAREALKEFQEKLNEELEGKLSHKPGEKSEKKKAKGKKINVQADDSSKPDLNEEARREEVDQESIRQFHDLIEEAVKTDRNIYEATRREVLPIIDALENDLRELFVARRTHNWEGGFKTGKKIDMKRRIQEKAKGISAVESHAWKRRELPTEKDYAITLLVDLSGSMARGRKIQETFKGAVVLAEVLNRLSIETEILGFNDRLYEYQAYGQDMSPEVRELMGGMLQEVGSPGANWNDDGWAVGQASERLARQKAKEKFLFVLSDGLPQPSGEHSGSKYELGKVIKRVMGETDQKLIGLGVGSGTEHVEDYYPNSIANIGVREMADKLADVIREAVANYDTF